MILAFSKIAIFLLIGFSSDSNLKIYHEQKLDFSIKKEDIFKEQIQMFYVLLEKDGSLDPQYSNADIDFESHILPLDVYEYYNKREDEEYFTLLTKTTYGFNQDVSYFTAERLSDEYYLQEIMPNNKLRKVDDHYDLKVGFGAPDISYSLDLFNTEEFNEQYPELVSYFKTNDGLDSQAKITALQHNYKFSKIMGQKTTKMSLSITRYFDAGYNKTMAINYTINFIHNLPPSIFGGSGLIKDQIEEGVIALVRDTRNVCQVNFSK